MNFLSKCFSHSLVCFVTIKPSELFLLFIKLHNFATFTVYEIGNEKTLCHLIPFSSPQLHILLKNSALQHTVFLDFCTWQPAQYF